MRRLAVIPARGGSKRIPRKNIQEFRGKPMIAWTIQAALDCRLFDWVVVSTDDEEIASVSHDWGAQVPFLRQAYADDETPVSIATCVCVEQMQEWTEAPFSEVCQLMPNCPMRTANDIRRLHDVFVERSCEAQISCFRFGWMNPWWAVEMDDEGRPTPLHPDLRTRRSQDLPPLYCPTGAVWLARTEALMSHRSFYQPDTRFAEIPWWSAVDIDDTEDLEFAHAVAALKLDPPRA